MMIVTSTVVAGPGKNYCVFPTKRPTHISGFVSRAFRAILASMFVLFVSGDADAQEKSQIVRLAKIEVDSAQLDRYKSLLKEGIEAAVRLEPGVITLYAMYEKNKPTHVTVLEVYASQEAYQHHLQTPHFKKYKTSTQNMVKSLELTDVVPIGFETKIK